MGEETVDLSNAHGRGNKIVETILRAKPDILGVQELDHMNFLQRRLYGDETWGLVSTKPNRYGEWYKFEHDAEFDKCEPKPLTEVLDVTDGEAVRKDPEEGA